MQIHQARHPHWTPVGRECHHPAAERGRADGVAALLFYYTALGAHFNYTALGAIRAEYGTENAMRNAVGAADRLEPMVFCAGQHGY